MKKIELSKMKTFIGKKVYNLLLLSVVAGLLWFLVELSFVYVFQYFLYTLKLIDNSQLSFNSNIFGNSSFVGIFLLIAFGIFRFLTSFFKTVMASYVQHTFIQEKRTQALDHALQSAGKISTGSILSIFSEITSQAGTMLYYLSGSIISGVSTALFILAGFYILPLEMSISLGLLLLFLIPYRFFNKKIFAYGKVVTSEWDKVNNSLVGMIRNNLFIKIYNLEKMESSRGAGSLIKYADSYKKYTINYALITLLPQVYGIIIIALVSLLSISKSSSSPIIFVSFLYLFLRMAQSASETLGTISFIKLNKPSFDRLFSWLALPSPSSEKNKIINLNSIKFKEVTFKYNKDKTILGPINFHFVKGQIIVIKGPSGAGKSTLLSLIMGILSPSTGEIQINDSVETEYTLSSSIGYVGPTPYLLNDTVRNNLLFGNSIEVSDQELYRLLDKLSIEKMVRDLPTGLNEILTEEAQLSTGQKQRLCIARALLQKPEVLILDEATANLDNNSEAKVINTLKLGSENAIVIVVTHKNSFDDHATTIINMDQSN